jgi:predicted CXXCH cytochrome family protein
LGSTVLLLALPSLGAAGIVNTKHNLVHSGRAVMGKADPTEVCAYCHTPHGQQPSRPQWNRGLPEEQTDFQSFDTFGRANLAAGGIVGSVSLACLSCHDGTQALNVLSNMPGEGVNTSGPRVDVRPAIAPAGTVSETHPVGVPYAGFRMEDAVRQGPGARVISDPVPREDFRPVQSAIVDEVRVWWVETGGSGRQRTDIHLYSRDGEEGLTRPYVECSSCHDPHAESNMFLRMGELTGDTACVACHSK